MLSILDYDMANLRSVQKGFEHVGAAARIISKPDEIESADKLVLPGVGAFADAVATLRSRGLDEAIARHVEKGKPLLGICLGLQILFDVGFEDGTHQGLGILKGKCVRFEVDRTLGLKVPHMGWNQLQVRNTSPLFRDFPVGASVYFVHGYHVIPDDASIIATTTDYGGDFVSSIRRDNLMAVQFHPEKSSTTGLQMLSNFVSLVRAKVAA